MPRRLLGVFMLLLVSAMFVRAQGDAVLIRVGTEHVTLDEFRYHFSKSKEKRTDVFVETLVRFKQMVQEAKRLGLDTFPEFRKQREYLLKAEAERMHTPKRRLAGRHDAEEWVKLIHVTYPLKQRGSEADERTGKQYMDSLYMAWKNQASLPEQLKELPWMQTRHLQAEWQTRLMSLDRNEFSEPFFSPVGIHLIAWVDKCSGKDLREANSQKAAFRLKEMEEGLLTLALYNYLERSVACTERELEMYFKAHSSEYGGGTPHYKGVVIHSRNKKAAKAVKKYLKKYPEALWKEALKRMPDKMAEQCRYEVGLFPIGTNPYVDKLAFSCGDFTPLADYPYTWIMGERLSKGPTDYRDVREELQRDCLKAKKKSQIEAFIPKYAVEIDKEILKTVNRAENK